MNTISRNGSQRGFALIAVLWLVAALSVMVGGLMQSVKSETRAAALSRQVLVANATGEAAIQLALQEMLATGQPPTKSMQAPVQYGGVGVMVRMIPMTGYIDINTAPPELLRALFQYGAGMEQGAAETLANTIISLREEPTASGQQWVFEAPEDLMLLQGVNYEVYARIARLITTDGGGGGGVNPQAASPEVLSILAGGDASAVASYVQAREGDNIGVDTSRFNGAWLDTTAGANRVELLAQVPMPDGGTVTVTRRYTIAPLSRDGLPWRPFYASSTVELASTPLNLEH